MPNIEQKDLMKLPVNDRRRIIRSEVLARIKKDRGYSLFNNFYSILPGGDRREKLEHQGLLDTPLSGFREKRNPETSDLKWGQTPRQFFESIDRTIDELHIPKVRLLSLQRQLINAQMAHPSYSGPQDDKHVKEQMRILNQIDSLSTPLYIELRVKGYSRQDLSG